LEEKTPNADEALNYFRDVAKKYAAFVPGANQYIDPMFDTIDDLKQSHGDETEKILKGTYDEIKETISKGSLDVKTGQKLIEILKRRAEEVEELAKKVGQDAIQPILDKSPELKKAIGGNYDELKRLVEAHGDEAKAKYEDLVKQLKEIYNKGLSPDSIKQVQDLVQQKTKEIKELGQKAGQDAWDKASKQAKPYLDKMPEIKKALDENAQVLIASGGKNIQEVYDKIKEAADKGVNKNSLNDLQNLIKQKVDQARQSGNINWDDAWKSLEQYIQKIPGGSEVRFPFYVETYRRL